MANCLFCKIINEDIPSEKVYENEQVLGFKDINPVAPIHLLFIHKKHSHDICDLMKEDEKSILDIFRAINQYVSDNKISNKGFRIINNMGKNGGQTVFHTHFHLLAGTSLPWP